MFKGLKDTAPLHTQRCSLSGIREKFAFVNDVNDVIVKTTVYYGIHKRSECIPVDCGVTNLIHNRRSCDFTLEVEANVARCVHSSVNKPGMKRNSGL